MEEEHEYIQNEAEGSRSYAGRRSLKAPHMKITKKKL
jgi:hypothetical protein